MSLHKIPVLVRGRTIWDKLQFPAEEFAARHDAIRQLMENEGLDGLLIYGNGTRNGPVTYLTNFQCFQTWTDAIYIFPKVGKPVLMACLPPRDVERVKTFIVDTFDLEAAGLSLVSNHHLTVKVVERMASNNWLGLKWGEVNLQNISAVAAVALQKALGDIPDYTAKFTERTVQKSARELSVISQAAQMARRAALELIRSCRPGQTEYQAVSSADRQLRLQGVEDTTILLAAGPEAQALHLPTEREFQSGDTIKVYIAVQYLRYWGAFGTTASIGDPAKPQTELYRKLEELFDNLICHIRGTKELDASYFSQIKLPKGVVLSPYSALNGIGLDLLEEPSLLKQQRGPLTQGMTLNLTLGLDQDGSAGVIASDTLQVEENSINQLSGPRPAELLTFQP